MISTPKFIYGTAWKTDTTGTLVKMAIANGFMAIDTANQAKHYSESLVGDALQEVFTKNGIDRKQLFLQTKFTPSDGHDNQIPYDPAATFQEQVETSFKSSLDHLQTDYIDSYLLHGPYSWPGLGDADRQVWQTMENIYESGQAKLIGISNVNLKQLELLTTTAKIKPMVVQNRCFANQGWDKNVREFCRTNHIMYQGFSLLTANPEVWQHKTINEIATQHQKTPAQIIFQFAIHLGIVPLTGTCSEQHMQQDLEASHFELSQEQISAISSLGK